MRTATSRKLTPRRLTAPPDTPLSPPPGTEPDLWLVETDAYYEAVRPELGALLTSAELHRAATFHEAADQRSYLAAHAALRQLLGRQLGTEPRHVRLVRKPCPLCRDPHGRPGVEGDPLHFSLSRSGSLSLLGFAAVPHGVDVERIAELELIDEVTSLLHPLEREELRGLGPAERPLAFTRLWTRKEAYLKALGTGLGRPPDRDYLGTGPEPVRPAPDWLIRDVAAGPNRCAAVVALRAATPPPTPTH
ncbi:4'-phosphopantetheinyl transferase family protein [Streptomyces sp. NPDC002431]